MKVVRRVSELRALLPERGASRGFVPTMGALHAGHVSLLQAARASTEMVVMSIFVNPLQFGPGEDLSAYPRDEPSDLEAAERAGVDVVFAPVVEEMYPQDRLTVVSVGRLGEIVEGGARPGHFHGVATVVAKLFNLVQPDRAFFGQKDAQQVTVIKRMTDDLSFPVDIVVCPTVRDANGLALSSRNAYLAPEERRNATALWRALQEGRASYAASGDPEGAATAMRESLGAAPGVELDYAEAVDPDTFEAPLRPPILLVVAARVGSARLIDNLLVDTKGQDASRH